MLDHPDHFGISKDPEIINILRKALPEKDPENKFDPYELFIYDETKEIDGITIPQFAVFDHKFSFPTLKEGNLRSYLLFL